MSKTCNKCKEEDLTWDYDYHESTGKWRLMKNGKPHICKFSKTNKYRLDTKYDLVHCGKCSPSHYGWCRHNDLDAHNALVHAKGEVRVWQDFD